MLVNMDPQLYSKHRLKKLIERKIPYRGEGGSVLKYPSPLNFLYI